MSGTWRGPKKVLRTWVAKGRLKSEKHNDVAERGTWWLWRFLQDVVQFVWKKSSPGMYSQRKVTCRSLPYKGTTQELPRKYTENTQECSDQFFKHYDQFSKHYDSVMLSGTGGGSSWCFWLVPE